MENASSYPRTLRDAIRRRPGLFIGGTDLQAVHHLLLDNLAVIAPHYRHVEMIIHDDQYISLRIADAREQAHQADQAPEIITMMTLLKSSKPLGHDLDRERYLLPILNALSVDFTIEVLSDAFLWRQSFREGLPEDEAIRSGNPAVGETGKALIAFRLDPSIFGGVVPEVSRLERQCKELASSRADVEIIFHDESSGAKGL